MRLLAILLAAFGFTAPAWAGDLAVALTTPGGKPAADAVVMVRPASGAHGPIRFAWPYRMAQQHMTFQPFVLVVPVGAEVAFPNLDPVRHHVYSFSPAKTFELKLYGRDETRSVRFDKVGVVALGCNIHDDMRAFIRVVDTPWAGKTSVAGSLTLHDIPPGPATVVIWHPYLRARGGEIVRELNVPASGTLPLSMTLDLRAPPMARGMY